MKQKTASIAALLLCLLFLTACTQNTVSNTPGQPSDVQTPTVNTTPESENTAPQPPSSDTQQENTNPEQPSVPSEPLSAEALEEYASLFKRVDFNGLLRFPYTDGTDRAQIAPYLDFLFYDIGETDLTAEELSLLDEAGMFMELDEFRLPRAFVIDYLVTYLDMSREDAEQMLAEAKNPFGIYLSETDAWYMCHSDTAYMPYTFTHGESFPDSATVKLYYTNPFLTVVQEDGDVDFFTDATMAVTLSIEGGEWRVISNELIS